MLQAKPQHPPQAIAIPGPTNMREKLRVLQPAAVLLQNPPEPPHFHPHFSTHHPLLFFCRQVHFRHHLISQHRPHPRSLPHFPAGNVHPVPPPLQRRPRLVHPNPLVREAEWVAYCSGKCRRRARICNDYNHVFYFVLWHAKICVGGKKKDGPQFRNGGVVGNAGDCDGAVKETALVPGAGVPKFVFGLHMDEFSLS